MAGKNVCKECGYFTDDKKCPSCGSSGFAEKHKGAVLIFDLDESEVAKKINAELSGKYALKFN